MSDVSEPLNSNLNQTITEQIGCLRAEFAAAWQASQHEKVRPAVEPYLVRFEHSCRELLLAELEKIQHVRAAATITSPCAPDSTIESKACPPGTREAETPRTVVQPDDAVTVPLKGAGFQSANRGAPINAKQVQIANPFRLGARPEARPNRPSTDENRSAAPDDR
jgi:hypothetical protein